MKLKEMLKKIDKAQATAPGGKEDMNKMIKASDLYRLAKGLLEPGEEHLNPEYARALVELLVDVEGFDMTKKSLVARRLGIPKKHVPTICK